MTIIIISLLLLVSLLPNPTFTAHDGIVNGNEAKPHSRPYMVSIQVNGHHVCGGFLISDQFVLTAAYCKMMGDLTVVVGAHDLSDNDLKPLKVQSYFPHPKYKYNYYLENNIMLLKLKNKICKDAHVGLISLPKNGEVVKVGCSVAGWGTLWTNGPQSDRLMEAKTNILQDGECKSKMQGFNASRMICVYGSGEFCQRDSGSPLVCGDKPTAVGIASFHNYCLCNSHEHPNTYTRISAYRPWIRKITGK